MATCCLSRARKTPQGKRFGSSMVSVGMAATAYHAASGDLRCALRKLDYWTIAVASTRMVRALFPAASLKLRALNAASWALMPFQPTAVSTVNIAVAEVSRPCVHKSYTCLMPVVKSVLNMESALRFPQLQSSWMLLCHSFMLHSTGSGCLSFDWRWYCTLGISHAV